MNPIRGLTLFGALLGCWDVAASAVEATPAAPDGIYAEITTPRGVVTCELYCKQAPLTVANFVGLAEGSLGPAPRKPFFDGLTFHRVVPGFVIQGGDPLGNGEGGPGYLFPDEFAPRLRHDAAGILSMANSGPDTNGSQFFITLAPVNRLNYLHSVFGKVVAGLDVLPQIKAGDTMSVKIVRRGAAAEKFSADEKTFRALVAAQPIAEPPAFSDNDSLLPTDPPRAKILNQKLENFRRFTRTPLYVQLSEKFTPQFQGQTLEQLVESLSPARLVKTRGALVVWFVAENRWCLFAPGHPQLKLPSIIIEQTPATQATTPEQIASENKRRRLSAVNEVVDGLLFQLEPGL